MTLRNDGAAALAAGAAKIEITPPLEVGLLMSSVEGKWAPFIGVRKPLYARALVLEGACPADPLAANQRVAIVSLDLLTLAGKALGGFDSFKSTIVEAADGVVTPEEIVLACTHTHTAPESGSITDLYQTPAFSAWTNALAQSIGQAIGSAAAAMHPCSVKYGTSTRSGLGIHRRLKTTAGIMMSHPEPPAETVVWRDGAVDDTVNVLWLSDEKEHLIAAVVNATCHPVYEMCNPEVSPDYPGELCDLLEADHPEGIALFLNGAAGNINPRGVSAGQAAAERHAEELYAAVQIAVANAEIERDPAVRCQRRDFQLSTRLPSGRDEGVNVSASVVTVGVGQAALVFLPGEPFVETGNAIRECSPFAWTAIVGFSEETVGYIPTDEAFVEGGYETGFGGWSLLSPGCEPIVREAAIGLLQGTAISGPPPRVRLVVR